MTLRARILLPLWAISTLVLGAVTTTLLHDATLAHARDPVPRPLPIPPLAKNTSPDPRIAEFSLKAQSGHSSFFPDKQTDTIGYNGSYLGPTLRVSRGQRARFHVDNDLTESITTHWHGMILPGAADGGPHQLIQPGTQWTTEFLVDQPAATLWYHAHPVGATAHLVNAGLAGFLFIDDPESTALSLPHTYGVDDVPLLLQDHHFLPNGQFNERLSASDLMNGPLGDTLLVNGAIEPTLAVPAANVRFRVLNASNARVYHLRMNDDSLFSQIASDGGLLTGPLPCKVLTLAPGERAECVIDFAAPRGAAPALVSDPFTVLHFVVQAPATASIPLPPKLVPIDRIPPEHAQRVRTFSLQTMGMTINGRQMNLSRIDEAIPLHATEIWTITNQPQAIMMGNAAMRAGGMHPGMPMAMTADHSFHIHGVQFQILDRNGQSPGPAELGWKDTILLSPGDTARLIMTFNQPGIFMYHCHVLQHEDQGMMGQFEVR